MWLRFLRINNGILAFLKTLSMVFANLTYLDSLNRYIVLCPYKALMVLSEKRLVSTKPAFLYNEWFPLLLISHEKVFLSCYEFVNMTLRLSIPPCLHNKID